MLAKVEIPGCPTAIKLQDGLHSGNSRLHQYLCIESDIVVWKNKKK